MDFYRQVYSPNRELMVVPLNELISREKKEEVIEELCEYNADNKLIFVIIKLNQKLTGKKKDLQNYVPEKLKSESYYVIGFDIYSTKPVGIKDRNDELSKIFSRWEGNISKLGG